MPGNVLDETSADLVARVCAHLQDSHPKLIGLQELGTHFHISPYHLQRIFKKATGVSPHQYAANLRLEDFKTQLRQGCRITDAMVSAGYSSSSRLYERSDEQIGMTPSVYKKRGQGMTIFYSVVSSALGHLLVGVTERGICKLSLGDASAELVADLESEFARAERIRDDEGVGYWVEKIIAWLEGWQPHSQSATGCTRYRLPDQGLAATASDTLGRNTNLWRDR